MTPEERAAKMQSVFRRNSEKIEAAEQAATRDGYAKADEAADGAGELGLIRANVLPNDLDKYENVSYKFRLFMMSEITLKNNMSKATLKDLNAPIDNTDQITIAQTGKTGIFIGDVNIESFVTTNAQALSSEKNKFTIKLIEPYGVRLFDKMFEAAKALGIANFAKTPMYLELTFGGYDEFGTIIPTFNAPEDVSLQKRIWKVQITTTEMQVTASGAEYVLLGYLLNDMAVTETIGSLPSDVSAKGTTFNNLLEDFLKNWNKEEEDHYILSGSPKTQYKVILHKDKEQGNNEHKIDWADEDMMKLTSTNPRDQKEGNNVGKELRPPKNTVRVENHKAIAQFTKRKKIQTILDSMVSSTVWAEKMAEKINDNRDPEKRPIKRSRLKSIRVEAQVIYYEYDNRSNDYNKIVIYHVWPFDTITTIMDNQSTTRSAKRAEAEKKAMEQEISDLYSRLGPEAAAREYSYIFTGTNTSVLNLDLRYNQAWQAFVPSFQGKRTQDATAGGEYILNAGKLTPEQLTVNIDKGLIELKETNKKIKELEKASRKHFRKSAPTGIDAVDEQARQEKIALVLISRKEIKESLLIQRNRESALDSKERETIKAASGNTFSAFTETTIEEFSEMPNKQDIIKRFPITIRPDLDIGGKSNSTDLETDHYQGKNFYAGMMNQAYDVSGTTFINIDIEVRGDPYWLGEPSQNRDSRKWRILEDLKMTQTGGKVLDIDKDEYKVKNLPNFLYSEQLFLLTIGTPNGSADDINNMQGSDIETSDMISGLYAAREIKHTFSGGKFTQTITAMRDPVTARYPLSKILERAHNNEKILKAKADSRNRAKDLSSLFGV